MIGWVELLVIGGIIMLLAGPAGVKKLMSTAQSVRKAKSQLTGRAALEKLIGDDDDDDDTKRADS